MDVVTKAFLGLTVACARCHNHKFDPIPTRDYYSLISIFASTKDFSDNQSGVAKLLFVPLVPQQQYQAYRADQDRIHALETSADDTAEEDLDRFLHTQSPHLAEYMIAARRIYQGGEAVDAIAAKTGLNKLLLGKWVDYLKEGGKAHPQLMPWDNAGPDQQSAIALTYQQRFETQQQAWDPVIAEWRTQMHAKLQAGQYPLPEMPSFAPAKDQFFYEVRFDRGPFALEDKERDQLLSPETARQVAELKKQIADLKSHSLPEPPMACAVQDGQPVDQKILIRGDYNNPGDDAPKSFPQILGGGNHTFRTISGRLELAGWIASADNPATARVMVNRVWQWHFGEGLVRTPDNFGKMGDRPSHPELLDFLARKFVESGWSVKALNRMIMLSSVYQTASDADDKTMEADPENRLLAHFNRQRLDVEEIRDGLLAIGGTLDLTMFGTLQKGFGTDGENSSDRLSVDPLKLTRRTVYLPLRRANLPTLLNLFDFGDATTVNGKRTATNVAPQTLFMMNSEFGYEHARRVAKEVLALPKTSDRSRLEEVYLRIVNRKPEPDEIDDALTYIDRYAQKYSKSSTKLDAWESFCHILIASNEFVYLD